LHSVKVLHAEHIAQSVCVLVCRLPGLFENLFRPPSSGPGLQAYISLYNSIWLFVFACVAYGIVSLKAFTLPTFHFMCKCVLHVQMRKYKAVFMMMTMSLRCNAVMPSCSMCFLLRINRLDSKPVFVCHCRGPV
jgi:hypothetical protein